MIKRLIVLLAVLTAYNTYGQVIISEYYEGSSSNKWIEVTNVGPTTIDLTSPQLYLSLFANAAADDPANSTANNHNAMSGSLSPGQVILYQNSSAVLPNYATGTNSSSCNFNGNDLIVISSSSTNTTGDVWAARLDVIGDGSSWGSNKAFYRNSNITSANTTYTTGEWTQATNSAVDNASNTDPEYLGTHLIEGFWSASASTSSWSTTSNWDDGNVPTSSISVVLRSGASNDPEISGDVGTPSQCDDLTILSGATLTVPVDKCLTVNGNLSNSGTLTIASTSSNGNGSIIVSGTASGTTTVQRWVEAYSGDDDGWHLISSAVDDMAISGSDFVPGGSDDLYSWDEDDYIWRNYSGGSFPYTNFNKGVGFLVAYQASATKAFSGTLNVDDITFSNLTYTSGTGDGWHLLGNPYASALTWNDGNWTLTNVGGVAKVYDESAGNYVSISANGFIPSTNGFFVQVSSSTNTTTIPKAARAHNATDNYKSTNVVPETLNLTVSNDGNGFSDITSVGFRDDANTYFDWDFDSHKLFGQVTAPQLWTVSEDEEYSINNLPHVFESLVVPLNFQAGINTDYEISADGLESFFINSEILLEDLFTNQIINLREQPNYSFYGNVDDANERFLLHFYGITSVDNTNDNTFANIYTSNNILYLKHDEMPKDKSLVGVFSTTGQKVLDFTIEPDILNRVELNLPAGIYIVSLSSKLGVISEKVVIN